MKYLVQGLDLSDSMEIVLYCSSVPSVYAVSS